MNVYAAIIILSLIIAIIKGLEGPEVASFART